MAEPVVVLAIYTTTLERQMGIWCDRCLLPAGYRVVVASESAMHEPCGTYLLTGCLHCDEIGDA